MTYGDTMGLATAACSGTCPAVGADPAPGQTQASCVGLCPPGFTCPGGRANATDMAPCTLGSFCPAGSSLPTPCPAGVYGNATGLATPACSGPCSIGHYCPSGSTNETARACPPGAFGSSSGLATAACSGACAPGFWCPAGSTNATAAACPPGTYGSSAGLQTSACSGQCPPSFWCPANSTSATAQQCPAGVYGASSGLGTPQCSGPCAAGWYCPRGSSSPTAAACPAGSFCAQGSGVPVDCPPGTFGAATNLATEQCSGLCPGGVFGATPGLQTADCSGPCDQGTYCVPGSTAGRLCAPGSFAGAKGAPACADCGLGLVARSSGAVACDVCPIGEASQNSSGSSSCVVCPTHTISNASSCLPCEPGLWCNGRSALPCLVPSKCLGSKCAEGYTGKLCELCLRPDWYNTHDANNSCRRCDSNTNLIVGCIAGVYGAIVLCCWLHWSAHPNFWTKWSRNRGAAIAVALVGVHIQRLMLLNRLRLPFPAVFSNLLHNLLSAVLNGGVGLECVNASWSFTAYWEVIVGLVVSSFFLAFAWEALRVVYSRTCGRLVHSLVTAARVAAAADAVAAGADATATSPCAPTQACRCCPRADWGCNAHFEADRSPPHVRAETWWRRLRNSPLLKFTRFLGAGVLLQVCIQACTWQTVGSDRMQAGNLEERYDAPSFRIYIGASAFFIAVIGIFSFYITLDMCSRTRTDITRDNDADAWHRFREGMRLLRENPLLKIATGAAGRSITGGVEAQFDEIVNLDYHYVDRYSRRSKSTSCCPAGREPPLAPAGQAWALHLYVLGTLLTPLAFTFRAYYDTSASQQRTENLAEAVWLVVVDVLVMLAISALVLRRLCSPSDKNVDSCTGVATLLIENAQLVFFGAVGLATLGVSISCMSQDCSNRSDLGLALILVNFGVVLATAGWLAVRVCCCRACGGDEEDHCCARRCGTDEEAFAAEERELYSLKLAFLNHLNNQPRPLVVNRSSRELLRPASLLIRSPAKSEKK